MVDTVVETAVSVYVVGFAVAYVMQDRDFRRHHGLQAGHRRRASAIIALLWPLLMVYSLGLKLRHPRSRVSRIGRVRQ